MGVVDVVDVGTAGLWVCFSVTSAVGMASHMSVLTEAAVDHPV